MIIQTNLEAISSIAQKKQLENDDFILFLRSQSSSHVDQLVTLLNDEITPKIDCTKCGQCCQSLMIQVEADEIENLSQKMGITSEKFEESFVEKGSVQMLLNTIPCHFLQDNKCSIYENRFSSCREFPALHLPGFTARLFTIFMHYHRCPIIFNVVETLKERLNYQVA